MANDRDCENCIHKINGACKVWECKFEPMRGMTKEEAIEIIECGEISNRWGKDGEEVERMAIEALKQEPCEDCVRRQAVLNTLDNMDRALDEDRTVKNYKELLRSCYKVLPSVNPQKPICPSAGVDCEDCPAYEDAISKYRKIKQMLYEFKEMPLAPCLMKGHICAVHEILNEVIEPSASSSEKPRLIDPAYEKTLNKWIGTEVLDRIRNEMHATAEKHEDGVYYLRDEWIDEIIDKYAEEDKA